VKKPKVARGEKARDQKRELRVSFPRKNEGRLEGESTRGLFIFSIKCDVVKKSSRRGPPVNKRSAAKLTPLEEKGKSLNEKGVLPGLHAPRGHNP